ncbi:MAG: CocE/NonD family hydrolase, partial [Candidatus Acidiferrum sp.]
MTRRFRRIVRWFLGITISALGALVLLLTFTKLPGEEKTPSGLRRNTARYIKMHDGVPLAADVWLPSDYQTGQRLPVLLRAARYGRDGQFGWAFRLLVALKLTEPHGPGDAQTDYLNSRHFVVVIADARGSGASGGHREVEFSSPEISDLGELVNWAAQQPWSNGSVGTFGNSYEGTAAELAASNNVPALKAVAAFSSSFDTGMQLFPGGLYDQGMVQSWRELIRKLDRTRGDICAQGGLHGLRCLWAARMLRGVKRVDDDRDGTQLAAILAQRHVQYPDELLSRAEFRDERIPLSGGLTITLAGISPFAHRAEIARSRVALQVWCGWLDATVCE